MEYNQYVIDLLMHSTQINYKAAAFIKGTNTYCQMKYQKSSSINNITRLKYLNITCMDVTHHHTCIDVC